MAKGMRSIERLAAELAQVGGRGGGKKRPAGRVRRLRRVPSRKG